MTACVIGDRPHQARAGYLCDGHRQRLRAMLRDVGDEAAHLTAVPSMQQRQDAGGGAPAFTRPPAVLEAIVANDPRRGLPELSACKDVWEDADAYDDTASVLDLVNTWARLLREERELSTPDRLTVTGETGTLVFHLDWIAEQPWCDEFFDDMRRLLGQLQAVNRTGPDKPYCRCPVVGDDGTCSGSVWIRDETQWVWRRYLDRCSRALEDAPGPAVCDTCGAVWATESDRRRLDRMRKDAAAELARPRTDDGRPMLTAQELVDRGVVSSVNNVRVTALRMGVRAVRGHYDPAAFGEKAAG